MRPRRRSASSQSGSSRRALAKLAAAARANFGYAAFRDVHAVDGLLPNARILQFDPALQRNGYARESALRHLAASPDERVLPFLLLRADDIVPILPGMAERAGVRALSRSRRAARRTRAWERRPARALIRDLLARSEHRPPLVDASHDEGRIVRRAPFTLRLRTEPAQLVLREALVDFSTGERSVQRARSSNRRCSIPTQPFATSLVRRFASRSAEQRLGESRQRARAVLGDAVAATGALIGALGALGALAGVGLRSDAERVETLTRDPRARLQRKALRTLALLQR